jgi:hypothetical protein
MNVLRVRRKVPEQHVPLNRKFLLLFLLLVNLCYGQSG